MKRQRQQTITQTKAAELLGVTRSHLNRVLNGHRESASLRRRFNELVATQPQTQKG